MKDIVIIGGGISGLTAAVYTARANLKPLVIEGYKAGGQLTLTTEVENFPGFPEGVTGPELVMKVKKQAEKFGAEMLAKDVDAINKIDGGFTIICGNEEIMTKSIIIATGSSARWLGLESEKKYIGRGVSSCATCDGFFYQGKEIIVIGGGDSAAEESTFLTKFASKVYVVHRRDELRASKIMADRVMNNPKIEMLWNSEVVEVLGNDQKVTGVKLKNTKTGAVTEQTIDGIFLAIGHIPNSKFLKGVVDMDENGYVLTDRRLHTSEEGIFASGDVQDHKYRQAITAAGTGCQAALEAEHYLQSLE